MHTHRGVWSLWHRSLGSFCQKCFKITITSLDRVSAWPALVELPALLLGPRVLHKTLSPLLSQSSRKLPLDTWSLTISQNPMSPAFHRPSGVPHSAVCLQLGSCDISLARISLTPDIIFLVIFPPTDPLPPDVRLYMPTCPYCIQAEPHCSLPLRNPPKPSFICLGGLGKVTLVVSQQGSLSNFSLMHPGNHY